MNKAFEKIKVKLNKSIKRYIFLTVICLACLSVNGCGSETITVSETTEGENASEVLADSEVTENTGASPEKILVYVCGAVVTPGVYELEPGARVNDALEAAGGFSKEADTDMINLAEQVSDGQKVYFPVEGEEISQSGHAESAGQISDMTEESSGLVNINEAGVNELVQLPGIGETRAGQIVEYRDTHGRFSSKEDLKNVSGIGDSTYEKLESHITVD